ncbi:MAG: hypothetical protein M1831_006924 [Alyxoria varia]|nr:MAG: hypothetical protein M1831_006924 [Alyxoria varia]
MQSSSAEAIQLLAFRSSTSSASADDFDRHINMQGTKLGAVRAYWLGTVICLAGFLFGYDSGIVGGVLTLKSYQSDFHFGPDTSTSATKAQALAVSLQNLGAFAACFFIWPINKRLGRKPSLIICSSVFCIGVVIQTISTHSLSAFYVARVIAGLGLGGATVVVPIFSSEMTPKELRGQIGCFVQLFFTLGIFMSYWVDYSVSKNIKPSPRQWQIPIALQLIPAGLLGFGMLVLPESIRWHIQRGENDMAWKALTWVRGSNSAEVKEEMEEIKTGVLLEMAEMEGLTIGELLGGTSLKLMLTSFLVFMAQQATGATAFAYFSAQYFNSTVGSDGQQSLLLSGIFGVVKVVACGFFVFVLADRVGRRGPLIWGAIGMTITMVIAAAVVATHPKPTHVTSSGIATVAMIYLFVIIYNMSWGGLPWPYVSEIFPTRIREPGVGVGVASQWLWSFVFTLATPYMIQSMGEGGYGTFVFWAICNTVIAIVSYFFVKETNKKSLEEINADLLGKKKEYVERLEHIDTGSGSEEGGAKTR